MPFSTNEELEHAWLGAYGPDRELEAEQHLEALEEGDDAQLADAARAITADLDLYLQEGRPADGDLAELLTEQRGPQDVGSDVFEQETAFIVQQIEALERQLGREFSDEELRRIAEHADANRDANGAPDVQGAIDWDRGGEDEVTARMAAELERLADYAGRQGGLTPKEAERILGGLSEEERTGGAPFPDLVARHGDELKERVRTDSGREQLYEERSDQIKALRQADQDERDHEDLDHLQRSGGSLPDSEEERWERMALAGRQAAEEGDE